MKLAGAAELLIVGFEGTTASPELVDRIAARRAAGVILFARNLGLPDEIGALTNELAAATPEGDPPLIISVDQEGGRVQRLRSPFTLWPPMARLGAIDDPELSRAVGRAIGVEVAACGFNVDWAPVFDVNSNPDNPIIGDRAFATVPERAARHALAFAAGLESAGVGACGKHFPGHGDTTTDSHLELPSVAASERRLRELELQPFAEAVRAGVRMLMTAHVVYPAVDARPATLSRRWLTTILREELGFNGVVVSDDLDMKAVAEHAVEDLVVESLLAGVDCFLACRNPEVQARAEDGLERRAARDARVHARIKEARQRLRSLRGSLSTSIVRPLESLPLAAHAVLAARMR